MVTPVEKHRWAVFDKGFKIPFHSIFEDGQQELLSDVSSDSSSSSNSSSGTALPPRFIFSAITSVKPRKSHPDRLSELPLFVALRKRKIRQSLKELYGPLTIISSTSSGSMVYKGYSTKDGQTYAIKVFRFRYTYESHREYCLNISNEIYITTSLRHKNIVRTVDVLEENGRMYEVMEYCPYDLFTVFERMNPSRDAVNRYFVELVHGLAYLHHRGVAHRDLKLENLCLDEHGTLKIIDFGFATLFRSSTSCQNIRATGIFGSNTYIAPEVWTQESYDPSKDDIWAVGILYVGMLTQRFPWERATVDDQSFRCFLDSWDSIRLFEQCPPESIPLLKGLLDIDPDRRVSVKDILSDPWFQILEAQARETSNHL